MRKALLWATILTLGTLHSAAQPAKDVLKSFLEVVCSLGLHSAGTNQWGRARAEMMEKAAAMRYKVRRYRLGYVRVCTQCNVI